MKRKWKDKKRMDDAKYKRMKDEKLQMEREMGVSDEDSDEADQFEIAEMEYERQREALQMIEQQREKESQQMAEMIVSTKQESKHEELMAKRKAQDFKDREYDSDDEIKKEMMTYDDRLTYINQVDYQRYGEARPSQAEQPNTTQLKEDEESKDQLPIVLHEREIMENIENFIVTIVCGETGSGKST